MNKQTAAMRLQSVDLRIAAAAAQAGRLASEVRCLAVSKTRSADEVRALYLQGQRAFGENYLQEALDKMSALSDCACEWHFIGRIQSNKCRQIASQFDWVQTVTNEKQAQRLSRYRPAHKAGLNVCVQVNLSEDPNKAGVLLASLPSLLSQVAKLPGLSLRGVMMMPSLLDSADQSGEIFVKMADWFAAHRETWGLDTLSMGMSRDLETAIAAGATMVRIGRALFSGE